MWLSNWKCWLLLHCFTNVCVTSYFKVTTHENLHCFLLLHFWVVLTSSVTHCSIYHLRAVWCCSHIVKIQLTLLFGHDLLSFFFFFFFTCSSCSSGNHKKVPFFSDKHHYTRMKTNVFIKCGTWSSAVVSVVGAKIANAEGSSYLRGFFQVHKFDLINALHFFSLCHTFSWDRVLSLIAHTRKLQFFSFKVVVSNFGWGKWIVSMYFSLFSDKYIEK